MTQRREVGEAEARRIEREAADVAHEHSGGCYPGCPAFTVIARVWRESLFWWRADVWTTRMAGDPLAPVKPLPTRDGFPEPPNRTFYYRRGVVVRHSRRAARRAAREMADRVRAGLPAEPIRRPVPEIVT